MTLPQYQAAEDLERTLGDPFDARNPSSHARAVALDEAEEFPSAPVALLYSWGYADYLVPRAHGGKLDSMEESAALQRMVSRRDLTVAIALGQTFLGSVATWLAGSPEQRQRLAEIVRGGGLTGLALTEEEHGSDVLASEVSAEGSSLTGRKWLINNGTRGDAWTVFARTDPAGGVNGFSLFLVEKGPRVSHLSKKRTHGIRGADVSGLVLDGAEGSLLGARGSGMELVLKCLQITRTGCAQFSLGAADTALRTALDFALGRKLYGGTAFEIPHAQVTLTEAFLDLLACDCLALAATRALHAAPGQMSLWSAVVKYFVPTAVERAMRELAAIVGARHYLREGRAAIFQKMLRDGAVVPLFDGSTAVNLDSAGVQLLRLSRSRSAAPDEQAASLRGIFSLRAPLPPLDVERLELMNSGRDDLTQGIDAARFDGEPEIAAQVRRLALLIEQQEQNLAALGRPPKRSPELFELARRHCVLSAAAACVHLWQHSREELDDFFASGDGLVLCLDRMLSGFDAPGIPRRHPRLGKATEAMLRLHRDDRLFSVMPLQLARRET